MKSRMALRMTFARKAMLALAGIAAVAAPIIVGIMNAPSIQAQSQPPEAGPVVLEAPVKPPPGPRMVAQQSVAPRAPAEPTPAPEPRKLEFEVASVKPVDPGVACCPPQVDSARFTYTATLHDLIGQAYRAFFPCPTKADSGDCAFPGAPAWIYKDRFAIEAKLPEGLPAYSQRQFVGGRAPQLNQMLQALLEDRFKLKVHWEARTIPIYALTVGKKGQKLTPTAEPAEQRPNAMNGSKRLPNGNNLSTLNAVDSSMQDFANSLGEGMDRPVLDRTGLKGNFDFKVEWESEPDAPSNSGPGMIGRFMHAGPAMFSAIEEQLGLKLESTKGPVQVLVIDHVEPPSPN